MHFLYPILSAAALAVPVTSLALAFYNLGNGLSTSNPIGSVRPWMAYQGCYPDNSARILPISGGLVHKDSVYDCIAYCYNQGYYYAGTEFGGECFCSNIFRPFSGPVDDSVCSMKCKNSFPTTYNGNIYSRCGRDYYINVWQLQPSFDSWPNRLTVTYPLAPGDPQ